MKPEKFLNEQGFWILDLAFLKQIFCLIRLASLDPGADSDAENWTSPGRGCGRGGCPMVCRGITIWVCRGITIWPGAKALRL